MEHGSRTRLMTALVLVVVFGAGLMIGLATDGSLSARPADEVARQTDEDASEAREEQPRRRRPMYEQVEPSEAQMALIDSIVRDYRREMRDLNDEFEEAYNPRYDALIAATRESIKEVLTPEQAEQYQQLIDERERRRSERDDKEDRE